MLAILIVLDNILSSVQFILIAGAAQTKFDPLRRIGIIWFNCLNSIFCCLTEVEVHHFVNALKMLMCML